MLACPFCGAPETDRFVLDGRRFLVFRCLFTPELPRALDEEGIGRELRRIAEGGGGEYFRRMCDRLHLYVTAGDGAHRLLKTDPAAGPPPGAGASAAKRG